MLQIRASLMPVAAIVLVCCWLVHVEGDSYRRRFRETDRPALWTRLIEDPQVPMIVQGILGAGTDEDDQPKPRPPVETSQSTSTSHKSGSPIADSQPQVLGANVPFPGSNTAGVSQEPSKPVSVALTSPAVADLKALRPESVLLKQPRGPFDPLPSGTDLLKLSHDEEVNLGQAVHDLIRNHHRLAENRVFVNHLYALAEPFRDQRSRKDLDIKIYLLDSSEAVTFSHLGGYIYFSRCLERLIPNDPELEFLIAHEIAHVDQHHGLRQVAKAIAASSSIRPGEPGLVQRIYSQIAAGHDSDQERAADEWAARQLLRLGRTRHEILSFLRRLENYRVREGDIPYKPQKPRMALEAEVQDIEAHLQRHPPIPFRVRDLEKIITSGPSTQ